MLRADLHVHTCYSPDSNSTLDEIIERCENTGINCLAICDHGSIQGALALEKIAPFKIVIGEEILTPYGDVIGLFLTSELPAKLPLEDAIKRIKAQCGIVCIPHPFDRLRNSAFCNKEKLICIIKDIDIIEVFNARSITPGANRRAKHLAEKYNKPASAGSDAHSIREIGHTYVNLPEFSDKSEFLLSLKAGTIVGRKAGPFVHFLSTKNRMGK